ncbi:hypothetical protein C0992_002062 [Termitomyces sp. T32_za158]|nr:hypothetical protein C0992_002062 [Termitomyces sp. T32_za158]
MSEKTQKKMEIGNLSLKLVDPLINNAFELDKISHAMPPLPPPSSTQPPLSTSQSTPHLALSVAPASFPLQIASSASTNQFGPASTMQPSTFPQIGQSQLPGPTTAAQPSSISLSMLPPPPSSTLP